MKNSLSVEVQDYLGKIPRRVIEKLLSDQQSHAAFMEENAMNAASRAITAAIARIAGIAEIATTDVITLIATIAGSDKLWSCHGARR